MGRRIYLNDGWDFVRNPPENIMDRNFTGTCEKVRIPHTFCVTPYNYFDESIYQLQGGYRKNFITRPEWGNHRVFITFDGAAHRTTVFLNGTELGIHSCGYTAFTFDMTSYLVPEGKENILCAVVDSRESLDQPPFGFVIDYMTYGGIYRDIYIEVKPQLFIRDAFVKTRGTDVEALITLNSGKSESAILTGTIFEWNPSAEKKNAEVSLTEKKTDDSLKSDDYGKLEWECVPAGAENSADGCEDGIAYRLTASCPQARLWTPENPFLYVLTVKLSEGDGTVMDFISVRFGFRDIAMRADGFYLNGEKYKIRGLNRHQSYPYFGYAAGRSLQRYDADILKNELSLNAVRTSHYPQSQYFIDRCDEIGLLVFTEIPGWQHIGISGAWRSQVVRNVRDMVTQYRNHPSVFLWGVRINESCDDDGLYALTNSEAHRLDDTRPTGGVRYLKHSHLMEDVYTYNDFLHDGINPGCAMKRKITSDMKKAYLISEYNGHMYPSKMWDDENHRTEHAIRHATVLDAVASRENIAGSFGWCAFDYNTHRDFGSGDRICYHGVMDMFRNPKTAAAVYRSQGDAEPVLEISTTMDVGEHPACVRGKNWIFTNADSVLMYRNDVFIAEYKPSSTPYRHLKHGPMLINDYIGSRLEPEYKGLRAALLKKLLNKLALNGTLHFSADEIVTLVLLEILGVRVHDIEKLYSAYIGAWGGEVTVFRFDAVKDGRIVKSVSRGPVTDVHMEYVASSATLTELNTYDEASVRIRACDQWGNTVPYFTESISMHTEGPLEIRGNCVTCFRGGYAGVYVRTIGTGGKASLVLESAGLKSIRVEFIVSV